MTNTRFNDYPRTGDARVDRAFRTLATVLTQYDDEVQAALALKQALAAALTQIIGLSPTENAMLIYKGGTWDLIDPPADGIGDLVLTYNDTTDTVEWS